MQSSGMLGLPAVAEGSGISHTPFAVSQVRCMMALGRAMQNGMVIERNYAKTMISTFGENCAEPSEHIHQLSRHYALSMLRCCDA